MSLTVACTDMGVAWCDQVVHGETEADLVKNALKHGQEHSGLSEEHLMMSEFLAALKNANANKEDD